MNKHFNISTQTSMVQCWETTLCSIFSSFASRHHFPERKHTGREFREASILICVDAVPEATQFHQFRLPRTRTAEKFIEPIPVKVKRAFQVKTPFTIICRIFRSISSMRCFFLICHRSVASWFAWRMQKIKRASCY